MPDSASAPSFEDQLKTLRREKLKPLLHDLEIARAVEDGRPRDLYRLLLKKRKNSSLTDRPLLDELLKNRRLFAEPVKRAPGMFTLNGVGTKLYGTEDADPSAGTHIATLFVVIFYVPVLPLAQYLVRRAGGTVVRRTWYFLAKVPRSRTMELWRQLAAGACVIAGLIVVGTVLHNHLHSNLQLVNALDVPVAVTVDHTSPVKVPPKSRKNLPFISRGKHHLSAQTTAGAAIEELDVDIPSHTDVVAYNVLGAAPLFAVAHVYFDKRNMPTDPKRVERPALQHYCGQRFITRDGVPYVFTAAPREISLGEDGGSQTRWEFKQDTGGWRQTLNVLAAEKKMAEATTMALAIATIEPDNEEAVVTATSLLFAQSGAETTLKWTADLASRAPQAITVHRVYQSYLERAGRMDEARAQYRKLSAEHPDSALYGYLDARVEPLDTAMKLFDGLSVRYPNDPYIERGCAWGCFLSRRFANALTHFEHLAQIDSKGHDVMLSAHARSLIALGRTNDAVQLVASRCEAIGTYNDLREEILVLYGRLVTLAPSPAAERTLNRCLVNLFEEDSLSPEARAWFWSKANPTLLDDNLLSAVTNEPLRMAAMVARLTPTNPPAALKLAREIPDERLRFVDESTLILLACEAARVSDSNQIARLLLPAQGLRNTEALKAFLLRGVESPELAELDLEFQAAVNFSRARTLQATGASAGDLYERALQDDLLAGQVTRAVHSTRR